MFSTKTFSSVANATNLKNTSAIALSIILIGGLFAFSSNSHAVGEPMIMPVGEIAENCDLNWYWDNRIGQLAAWLESDIVITNVTDTAIEGKITSANNNHTLSFYNGESVVMAQFGYDYGFKGDWHIAARPANGIFTIDIPAEYADADYVKLWVNGNSFVMQPPQEEMEDAATLSAEDESAEDTTTITSTTNSTTTTTTVSKTVETDSTTNSTIITITTVTEITPTEESEATNSTTITTVTTTTIDSSGAAASSTVTTTTTESMSELDDSQPVYLIGGNMTINQVQIHAPAADYWVNDDLTLFFEEGHFMLNKRPMSLNDVEEDIPAEHSEVYQTQIEVTVSSGMTTYRLKG